MKVSVVTRYPYLWHNITVTDDVNLKNSFLCYLLGDDFSGDLIFYNLRFTIEKIAAQFYLAATVHFYIIGHLHVYSISYKCASKQAMKI
jgi:hypothetical protein